MHLGALTKPELIFSELPGSDRPTVLRAMAERLVAASVVDDADDLYRRLWEREKLGTTGIGSGVAIPHCKLASLDEVVVAIGLTRQGVDFESEDAQPVRVLFLVVSPEDTPAEHLRSLAAISKWVKAGNQVDEILDMEDPQQIFEALQEEEV